MQRDPVCGMELEQQPERSLCSKHESRTFWFCSRRCREQFDRDPVPYLMNESARQRAEHRAGPR